MNIFDLQATISLNGDSFMQGVQQAQGAFSGLGSSISAGAVAIGNLASSAITAAGSAVVGFGKDAIQTGMSFESAMSQVAATLGMTTADIANNVNGAGDSFNALKAAAAEMGRETMYSATNASEGLNILAMSGFSAEQAIQMLPDVLHLAAAGSMSLGEAASYISGSMKGFADDTKDAGYYADLMAKGATLASTSVSQFGDAMSSGAAGANAFGQSAEAMTVSLLRLAEQNEVGSAAGTAYARLLQEVFTPKTDDAAAALKNLGVSTYDETGKARDLNDIVNDLYVAMSDMDEETRNSTKSMLFGSQALDAYNKMTVTGTGKQEEWKEAIKGASDGMGEAAKQYGTMTENLQGALSGLNSAFEGLQNAVFEKLSGPLQEAAKIGAEALNKITAGFEEGGLKGALSSLGTFIKEKLSGIWDGLKLPPWVGTIANTLKTAFGKVKAAIDSLNLGGRFEEHVERIKEAFETVKTTVEKWEIGEKLKGVAEKVREAFDKMKTVVSGWNLSEVFAGIAEKLKSGFDKIDSDIQGFLISLYANEKFQAVIENIKIIGESVVFAFKEAFNGDGFSGIASELTSFFGNVYGFLLENMKLPPGVYDAIINIQTGITEAFGKVKEKVAEIDFAGIFGGIKDKIATAFDNIRTAVDGMDIAGKFSGVKEKLGDAFNGIREFAGGIDFEAIFGGIKDKISSAIETAKAAISEKIDAIRPVFDDLKNVFLNIGDAFSGFDMSFVTGIAGSIGSLVDTFQQFGQIKFDAIVEAIHGFADAFTTLDIGGSIANFAQNVGNLIGAFAGASADVISGVAGAVKDFLGGFSESEGWNAIGQIAKDAADLFNAFIGASADTISAIGGGVKSFLDAFPSEDIGGVIAGIAESAGNLFGAFKNVASTVVSEIAEAVKTFLATFDYSGAATIIEKIAEVVGTLFGHFSGAVAGVVNSIADAFAGFGSKIAELWNTAGPNLSLIGDAVASFADYVKGTLDMVMPVLEAIVNYFANVFAVGIQIAIDQVISIFGGLVDSVSGIFGAIMEFGNAMISLFKGDLTGAVEHFKHMWEDIKAFFSGLASVLIEPFRSFARVLGDEANNGVKALKAPFEKIGEWFRDIGGRIVEGLKTGISNAWSSLTSRFSDKITSLTDGVLSLLGINSPSKVYAAIGSGMVEGLEVGWGREFTNLEAQVYDSLGGLVSDVGKIGFDKSALGRSSEAGISSMWAAYAGGRDGTPYEINLVIDGDVAAKALYDPLRRRTVQRGEEVMNYA